MPGSCRGEAEFRPYWCFWLLSMSSTRQSRTKTMFERNILLYHLHTFHEPQDIWSAMFRSDRENSNNWSQETNSLEEFKWQPFCWWSLVSMIFSFYLVDSLVNYLQIVINLDQVIKVSTTSDKKYQQHVSLTKRTEKDTASLLQDSCQRLTASVYSQRNIGQTTARDALHMTEQLSAQQWRLRKDQETITNRRRLRRQRTESNVRAWTRMGALGQKLGKREFGLKMSSERCISAHFLG